MSVLRGVLWRLGPATVALGVHEHAQGTGRPFEIGPTTGAFASLGMSLTGILTALRLPLAWRLPGLVG